MLCEEGLTLINPVLVDIITPTQSVYSGCHIDYSSIVAVSIIRAGDSMLDVFQNLVPEASVGKILIQRDEETKLPVLYYSKLPSDIRNKIIVLLDPMLATGGSAISAVNTLITKGALEENILFFNVVSTPQGIEAMAQSFPKIRIITCEIDAGLNEKAYIVPGIGDFGDRYFGTT